MKKMILLAAVAALFVSMLGAPATAAHPDVVSFTGSATVSPGIYAPGVGSNTGPWSWSFSSSTCSTRVGGAACSIGASGALLPVGPAPEPYCGASTGANGNGTLTEGTNTYTLSSVGWTASAGSNLPVEGNWSLAGHGSGTFAGVVNAQGGVPCAVPGSGGATTFAVTGEILFR